jgi:hypothetical protein
MAAVLPTALLVAMAVLAVVAHLVVLEQAHLAA